MHELYDLKEKLIKELSDYSQNGKYSKEDVESIKYLASAVDHICNIVSDYDEEDGYSMDNRGGDQSGNRYSREGNRGGQGGSRYSREMRYSRMGGNSYARGRGRNTRRDNMGRYSRDGGVEELAESLGEMMGELPEEAKREAEKLMMKLEEMM